MLICGKLSVALKQTLRPLTRDPSTPLFGQPQILLLRPKTEKVRTLSTTIDSTQPDRYCRANASLTGPAPICQFWTNRKTVRSLRNEWMTTIQWTPIASPDRIPIASCSCNRSRSRCLDPSNPKYTLYFNTAADPQDAALQILLIPPGLSHGWLSKGIPH